MTHASSRITGVRSVALSVPDLQATADFFTKTWGLELTENKGGIQYFKGTGSDAFLISLRQSSGPAKLIDVSLRAASLQAIHEIQNHLGGHGKVISQTAPLSEPGGGVACTISDNAGRIYQIVFGDTQNSASPEQKDRPIRLAHVVLNSNEIEVTQKFYEEVFDFSLSDRTKMMAFMRCNSDHHSIAFGDQDNNALNHIAFAVPDLDAVMRGGGRLKDAGFPIAWGPGRHGPGNNTFNYFVGPSNIVVEYTSDIEQIDDNYKVGAPSDWTWPPGRIDQWGISPMPNQTLKEAQSKVFFQTPS
ncbi:MAG: VOC family protein [Betaproteobacteria bacterium]|jgi:catechol 2,3-dioxygenase-like lactoylglutathione lyase family enzyme